MPIVYVLWGMHCLCFAVQVSIYTYDKPAPAEPLASGFEHDDAFRLQVPQTSINNEDPAAQANTLVHESHTASSGSLLPSASMRVIRD